jgi:sugar lactone lactonase YvrE
VTTPARVVAAGLAAAVAVLLGGAAPGAEPRAPTFVLAWGKKGAGPGEFYSPIGIAVTPADEVVVTDLNNARVQRFTTDGKHLGGFDLPWDDPKRKSTQAGGVAVAADGTIYLSFMQQHKVAAYTPDGKLLRTIGKKGKGDGELSQPGGLLLLADGTVYVADQGNHRVQWFTAEGKYLGQWGGHGTEAGKFGGKESAGSRFGGPHFLARDGAGRFYATEGAPGRIQKLAADGKPLAAWADTGDGPGGFGAYAFGNSKNPFGPIAVAVDRHDRVWVSSLNDRVQTFTPDGKYLFGITESGKKPGELARPHGMAFDRRGFLYVADAGNQRVQKFSVPAP